MLKFDRISSTCDCFQSQVKWNSLPNQTNAHTHTHTHTHNYASYLNVFSVLLCVCFDVFWRVVRVYCVERCWKEAELERFQTWRLALPSRVHAHDGNRLQQRSGICAYYFVPLT